MNTADGGGVARLASLVSTLQLSDSAFPSGRYTMSYGLEAFAQGGRLPTPSSPETLLALLADYVRFGVAPSDGIALACSHRTAHVDGSLDLELVASADDRLAAVKIPREAREASTRTGRALLSTAATAFDAPAVREYAGLIAARRVPGNHAVVRGLISACLGVPRVDAVAGELYAFSAGWVAAAVRLALTDHRTAQRLLHEMRSVIARAALQAADRDVADIASCTPLLDVMAMRHEEADLRVFAS
jgi:urease accessory protein